MKLASLSATAAVVSVCGLACVSARADKTATPMADVLIEFASNPTPADVAAVEAMGGVVQQVWTVVPGVHASLSAGAEAQLLALDGRIVSISPNSHGEYTTEYDSVWGVRRIGCEPTHTGGQRGAGVAVGVMVSGLRHTHEDIAHNIVYGYNFAAKSTD